MDQASRWHPLWLNNSAIRICGPCSYVVRDMQTYPPSDFENRQKPLSCANGVRAAGGTLQATIHCKHGPVVPIEKHFRHRSNRMLNR